MAIKDAIVTGILAVRPPRVDDGSRVCGLVAHCPPLEPNSPYCYLLLCAHFAATCAVAEADGDLVGFLAGYRKPAEPDTLFVWQIATRLDRRGQGVARRLIAAVLDRPDTPPVRFLEATVTPENNASRELFRSFARHRQAALHETLLFSRNDFGGADHQPEHLLRIGPLNPQRPTKETTYP